MCKSCVKDANGFPVTQDSYDALLRACARLVDVIETAKELRKDSSLRFLAGATAKQDV